jgi:hypothetical protein
MGWTNKVSGNVDGNVTQIGVVHGDVHLTARRHAPSAYLDQVRALAPTSLEGREQELAALTAFCTSESTANGYLWWRAEAWSGKSALLSWFVLHPPPGTHLVSFFITSSLPHQNNRDAFVDNVLDQLHDTVDEPTRSNLTDTNREAYLRRLLATVPDQIRHRSQHFTLIVDGLDEDGGVDGSADAHSIAALLPRTGVRVVVASRPALDLPHDVPPDHPLHNTAVVTHLSPSPKAQAVRDTMIRDLKRLLSGTSVHQDLLGFTLAAGGGLAAQDLAELTGTSLWQVEDDLRATVGRSFTRRPGDPPVYALAHDDLQPMAAAMLGPRLDSYRRRLHAWAENYRARDWPPETPHYLLHGYTAALTAAGDIPRLLAFITDPRRHDRVVAVTGQDHTVLNEIRAAQELLLHPGEPDLVALARLAVHRTSLYLRNDWIPALLPAVWARIGQFDHAEALVATIGDHLQRSRALRSTAAQLHWAGEHQRTARLLDEAEALARTFNQFYGAWPVAELAEVAMLIGDDARARRAVEAIKHADERAEACASIACVALDQSRPKDAELWYREAEEALSRDSSIVRMPTLAIVAAAAARLGHSSRASALMSQLRDHVRTAGAETTDQPNDRQKAEIAHTLAGGGFIDMACTISATLSDVDGRERSLRDITTALADRDLDGAEELARSANELKFLGARLAAVARAAARHDDRSRADRLFAEIDQILVVLPHDAWRTFTIMATAVARANAGDAELAVSMVRSEMMPSGDTSGALWVALALAKRRDTEHASRLATMLEETARPESAGIEETRLLKWVAVLVDRGEFDRAETVVRSFPSDDVRSAGLATIAEGLVVAGALDRAEQMVHAITDPRRQRRPQLELLRALLARGQDTRALDLARSAAIPAHRAAALTFLAGTTRQPDLLDEVVDIALSATDVEARVAILLPAAQAAANLGDRPRTTALWQQLRTAQTLTKHQPEKVNASLGFLDRIPRRLRTLTELFELVDQRVRFSWGEDPPMPFVVSPSSLWFQRSDRPKRLQLAQHLAMHHWFDVVDDLVEVEPGAFGAIVSELDRLGSRGTFHTIIPR